AEDEPERVLRPQLVIAVGDDEQRAGLVDAAAEEFYQVERRLVGPVRILDDEQPGGLLLPEQAQNGVEEGRVAGAGFEEREQLPVLQREGDVVERAERARGEERLAGPPEHPPLGPKWRGEALDERRLADAGLAADEHDAPAAGRHAVEGGGQFG